MKLERKSDHIKVIESSITEGKPSPAIRCINCNEWTDMITRKAIDPADTKFCTKCGTITQLRTVKHGRGIAAPSIQQAPAIVQKQNSEGKQTRGRKPHGINDGKKNPLEESLILQGKQVIDSTWNEPTA